jgi:hypothetical protein
MFQTKAVGNIQTHFMFSNSFSRKYGGVGQAADDNRIQRMRFAYWITKATNTHYEVLRFYSFNVLCYTGIHDFSQNLATVLCGRP